MVGRTCDQNDSDMSRRITEDKKKSRKARGKMDCVVNNDKRKAGVRNWRTEATYRD
jgi:hypothetical protein